MTERAKEMDEEELMVRGFEALNRALGHAETLRILALIRSEPMDYIEISKKIYEGQRVDEIFKRTREHWKG